MSRARFDTLFYYMSYNSQCDGAGRSTVRHQWELVDDFGNSINHHRRAYVDPSQIICVDESISRWYSLGGMGLM